MKSGIQGKAVRKEVCTVLMIIPCKNWGMRRLVEVGTPPTDDPEA